MPGQGANAIRPRFARSVVLRGRRGPGIGCRRRRLPLFSDPARETGNRQPTSHRRSTPMEIREALTFDDVLAGPGREPHPAGHRRYAHAGDAEHRSEHSAAVVRDGHCDGVADGHRHGAGRRNGRDPPQPRSRRAAEGSAGASSGSRAGWSTIRSRCGPIRRWWTPRRCRNATGSRAFPSWTTGARARHRHQSGHALRR